MGAQVGGLENIPSPQTAAYPHQQSLPIPPRSSWQPLTHLRSLDVPAVDVSQKNGITLSIVFEVHPCDGEGRGLTLCHGHVTHQCVGQTVCVHYLWMDTHVVSTFWLL